MLFDFEIVASATRVPRTKPKIDAPTDTITVILSPVIMLDRYALVVNIFITFSINLFKPSPSLYFV
jgi:hypothetical protein